MNKPGDSMLIGELLRRAKLIKIEDLTNAIQVSSKTGLPIGRVLVMLGLIQNDTLTTAITAQSLVRDRLITLDTAVKAVQMSASYKFTLTEALERLGCLEQVQDSTNKLGDLLTGAGFLTAKQVEDAMAASQHLGLPLGRILALKGYLDGKLVQAALTVQSMIRDGDISREDGIDALRTVEEPTYDLDAALLTMGMCVPDRPHLRLGELLEMSGLVSEADLVTALEVSLANDLLLGDVLIDSGYVNELVLDAAIGLLDMINLDQLTVNEANEALRMVGQKNFTLTECMSEINRADLRQTNLVGLVDLLKLAGMITDESLSRSIALDPRKVKPFDEVLTRTSGLTEATVHIAMRCQTMIEEGALTLEQAIIALHYWQWSGATLAEIIEKFGWQTKAKRQIQNTVHDLPVADLAVVATKKGTWEQKKSEAVSK